MAQAISTWSFPIPSEAEAIRQEVAELRDQLAAAMALITKLTVIACQVDERIAKIAAVLPVSVPPRFGEWF
jgi:hypothetical protein